MSRRGPSSARGARVLRVLRVLRFALPLAAAAVFASPSCTRDPVLEKGEKDLGAEAPGVPEGEYHRAGQPCLVCHQETGSAKSVFSVAGTIFHSKASLYGEDGADVRLVDSENSSRIVKTNCVGNFFISRTDWNPAFPILVTVSAANGKPEQAMKSLINRDGSCAACHRIPAGLDSPGHVYMTAADEDPPEPDCPVSPIVPIDPRIVN